MSLKLKCHLDVVSNMMHCVKEYILLQCHGKLLCKQMLNAIGSIDDIHFWNKFKLNFLIYEIERHFGFEIELSILSKRTEKFKYWKIISLVNNTNWGDNWWIMHFCGIVSCHDPKEASWINYTKNQAEKEIFDDEKYMVFFSWNSFIRFSVQITWRRRIAP